MILQVIWSEASLYRFVLCFVRPGKRPAADKLTNMVGTREVGYDELRRLVSCCCNPPKLLSIGDTILCFELLTVNGEIIQHCCPAVVERITRIDEAHDPYPPFTAQSTERPFVD